MKEALLYDRLEEGRVRCRICPHRCLVSPGRLGRCTTRKNEGGKFYSLIYGKVASWAADPIEKKPLFHFYPRSRALSLGTLGCNLNCQHCQNWTLSHTSAEGNIERLEDLSPEETVRLARENGCSGIAWTYNEPAIWLEYTIDSARLAKKEGLYTAYVTNGYITEEALDAIGPYLDAFRVDVKGFSNEFYHKICGVKDFTPVLESAGRAKEKWRCHIEVVTNIIPGYNDDEAQLRNLANWIKDALGEETPWHVTRFYPAFHLDNIEATPVATIERATAIGKEAGLKFVYVGNIPGHPGENTYCPGCETVLIERSGYETDLGAILKGKCRKCGYKIKIVGLD